MIISKHKMQKIAEEIGNTIHKDVNIMDETGTIIASTDGSRIGVVHEGAQKIIRESLAQLSIENTDKLMGAKDGINLPLQINGRCVGVVGITGSVSEVGILGTVIKKMTEILIWEEFQSSQKKAMDDTKNNFALEWLYNQDGKNLADSSSLLGIGLTVQRVVAVLEINLADREKIPKLEAQERYEKIADFLRRKLESNSQQFLLAMGAKVVCFCEASRQQVIQEKMGQLLPGLEEWYRCGIFCGIGTAANDAVSVRKSFHEAEVACRLSQQLREQRVIAYNNTDIRMLLGNISAKDRSDFLDGIFPGCTKEQIREMIDCLRCYVNCDGSVSEAAENMYIHKNTLQYRLSKIKNITGYDPRRISECTPLLLAVSISDFMN